MKARTEQLLASKGLESARAEARLRRHPRHRVRGAAAATRARPSRSLDPRPLHARRARPARGRRLRDDRRRPPARRRRTCGCARSSTGCSSSTSTRRTRSRPTPKRARTWRACSASATGSARSALEQLDARAPAPPGDRALDPREAVLRAAARHARRRRRAVDGRRAGTTRPRSGSTTSSSTRAALDELTAGLTRRSRVMQQLLPAMLGWLSAAPDPDLGLLALRRLTEGYNRSSTLARRFRDSPLAAERTCRILGSSRVLGSALYRQPDFVDALADDTMLTTEATRADLVERGARLARLARRRRRPPLRAPSLQAPPAPAHRRARRARLRGARRRRAASCRASPTRAWRPRCVRSSRRCRSR